MSWNILALISETWQGLPNNERDVLRLMELTRRANAFVSMPIITMLIGDLGKISRRLAERQDPS